MLSEKTTKFLISIGLLIFLTIPTIFLWKEPLFDSSVPINKEHLGQFGDFVTGVVGSIWALAGVILFYVALTEQRKDFNTNRIALSRQIDALNLQAKEFSLQRTELKQSRKIFETQSKTLKKQQFESTFFSMLSVFSDNLKNIEMNSDGNFFLCRSVLLETFEGGIDPQVSHGIAIESYIDLYFTQKETMSHYFMSLYRVFKLIDDSNLNDKEKYFYSKVVRSQLKENQLFFLYYNAHTEYGKNFIHLILKYNLLKHLPSLGKLELKRFFKKDNSNTVRSNRLFYCEWFCSFLRDFVSLMKANKYELLNEETQNRSRQFKNLCSFFELNTNDPNKITLTIHIEKDSDQFIEYLNLLQDEFIKFQRFLIYDTLVFSQFKEDEIQIETNREKNRLTFDIESKNGFDVISDSY